MRREVLFLSFGSPWPPHSGGTMRTWGLLRQIAARHDVDLIVLTRTTLDAEQQAQLAPWARSIRAIQMQDATTRDRLSIARIMASGLRPYHAAVVRHALSRHPDLLRTIQSYPGVVFTNNGHWGTLVAGSAHPGHWILNQCDADIDFWRAYADQAGAPLVRALALANYRLARAHFPAIYQRVGHIISVCEEDRTLTAPYAGHTPISVIANGIDLRDYRPHRTPPGQGSGSRLLFTGTSARRNVTALGDFLENVFPRVRATLPHAHLVVAGNFTAEAQAPFRRFDGMEFTGRVPDMLPYFDSADLFVAPFRDAHGTKLKVAEAMAMALPIVATQPAVRGFPLVHGESALIARDDAEFAEHILWLAARPEERERIGDNARRLAEAFLDWAVLGQRVSTIIESVGSSGEILESADQEPAMEGRLA